ncbi:RNA polymerase sigma-70 factor [Pedobacter hiemivivus]|jgi:RNA polymerase sigma-70 factor (family 1)|uniref:RNA polymerase sigma-70 factor n=1 Tax=Pedobacter hiemivivus TaxID=2530454 RepID=A0A4U1G0D1_9SPHI|nr:RNA polymerase sigma-70 factor [Pedobacter hiemivivus]TKC56907.1 RNA polymerase sigma-70 factor [Pedobacter hiemivivus]
MPVYSNFSDEELTVLLKQEDQIAFTEIYNRYWAEMYYHTFRMLRDEDSSKDVVQDVFSSLWLKSASLNVSTKLSGHLYISVRNKVLNLVAQNKVRNDYLSSVAAFITESTNDASVFDEQQILDIVEAEIQKLPPRMKEIFELSRKDNLSHKEIAKKLNLSDQTVKKQVQNALKIIKNRLPMVESGIFVLFFLR